MDISQYIGLLGSFLGCFGYLLYRIETFENRIEEKMQEQNKRTDRLYEMFIDLIKEGKK